MGWAVGNIKQGGPLPVATGVESCELKTFGADVRGWRGVGIHGTRGWGINLVSSHDILITLTTTNT